MRTNAGRSHFRSTAPTCAMLSLAALVACAGPGIQTRLPAYVPRVRELTVTTVPMLVKEEQALFPFLKPALAKGGVLEGKEVYAFSPNTLTVIEGDTIHLTLINPEDDVHSFVLPDLAVPLPGGTTTRVTYVATHAGIYPIVCAIPAHLPMMSGQLVVLPSAVMAEASETVGVGSRAGS